MNDGDFEYDDDEIGDYGDDDDDDDDKEKDWHLEPQNSNNKELRKEFISSALNHEKLGELR